MRVLTLLLILCLPFGRHLQAFSSLPVTPDCDTIITQKGKKLVVRVISSDKEKIRYQLCADSVGAPIRFITKKNVKQFKKAVPPPVVRPAEAPSETAAAGTTPDTGLPEGAVPEDQAKVLKKANFYARYGALFTFAGVFSVFFAIAFSPFVLLLTPALVVAGFVLSLKGVKFIKNRKELTVQRRIIFISFFFSLLMSIALAMYLLALLLVLLIILLTL